MTREERIEELMARGHDRIEAETIVGLEDGEPGDVEAIGGTHDPGPNLLD